VGFWPKDEGMGVRVEGLGKIGKGKGMKKVQKSERKCKKMQKSECFLQEKCKKKQKRVQFLQESEQRKQTGAKGQRNKGTKAK